MRLEIKKLHGQLKSTVVYVTHDQIEAMTMATKIAVMNKGVIQQFGTPDEIYDQPENIFVADFVGAPSMNMVDAVIRRQNGSMVARSAVGDPIRPFPIQVAAAARRTVRRSRSASAPSISCSPAKTPRRADDALRSAGAVRREVRRRRHRLPRLRRQDHRRPGRSVIRRPLPAQLRPRRCFSTSTR